VGRRAAAGRQPISTAAASASFAPAFGDLPDPSRFIDLAALDAMAALWPRAAATGQSGGVVWAGPGRSDRGGAGIRVVVDGAPNRRELLAAIFQLTGATKRPVTDHGWLDLTDRGHGFVVHKRSTIACIRKTHTCRKASSNATA